MSADRAEDEKKAVEAARAQREAAARRAEEEESSERDAYPRDERLAPGLARCRRVSVVARDSTMVPAAAWVQAHRARALGMRQMGA